jgi:muramoyltetrapeptide carboxypeptidase
VIAKARKTAMRKTTTGIAIIAPGGYAPDNDAVNRAIAELESQNCRVYNYYEHDRRFQRFGGDDAARLAGMQAAIDNPDVDIVIALRGGYGMSRLLPQLDFARYAASGKLFVGHSDFTAFQLALLRHGNTVSFAGPMICNDFTREDQSDFTLGHFRSCLRGLDYTVTWEAENNPKANVTGTLWGGNLTMIAQLVGTPWMPEIEGGILFAEDINEHPYRVERTLLHLHQAGILARQRALVLGNFSGYSLTDYDNGYDFDAMLAWVRAHLPIPVITGLPFGHIRDKVTLPVGARAQLISDGNAIRLEMEAYPTLAMP